jgi:hypothetical protein
VCKIMVLTGLDPKKADLADKFMKASVPFMTARDNDGYGYAAVNGGGIYGERWEDVREALKVRASDKTASLLLAARLGKLISLPDQKGYGRFGLFRADAPFKGATTIISHSRMATCEVSFENVHPFVAYSKESKTRPDVALIHNGYIDTSGLKNYTSTCDSECILNEYVDFEMKDSPANLQDFADQLRGMFALAVLAKTKEGKFVLDIIKDDSASLNAAYIEELGAAVLCTSAEIIARTAAAAGFKVPAILPCSSEVMVRFDAKTGIKLEELDFEARGWSISAHHNYPGYGTAFKGYEDREVLPFGNQGKLPEPKKWTESSSAMPSQSQAQVRAANEVPEENDKNKDEAPDAIAEEDGNSFAPRRRALVKLKGGALVEMGYRWENDMLMWENDDLVEEVVEFISDHEWHDEVTERFQRLMGED